MHRYRPDTVSVVLKYLRDFQTKLQAHKQHLQSIADSADAKKADKTKALKEITQLTKDLKELEDYERKVIYDQLSHWCFSNLYLNCRSIFFILRDSIRNCIFIADERK